MRQLCITIGALLALGMALGLTDAQETKKSTRESTEVDVQFANGSTVRMVLADIPIEIQTPYGKLAIPAKDLKRIEFGVHLPDGTDKQIEQAIGQLGSADFRSRENAQATLIKLGPMAFPTLLDASKNTDLELAKRAQAIIAKLQHDLPAKDLRVQVNDTIVTPTFTVVGRIQTSSIKAKADYFGQVQLDLVQLRTLRSTEAPLEVTVQVDAKYASRGSHEWLATDFAIDSRMKIQVSASGQIDLWPQNGNGGAFISTPRGNTENGGMVMIGGGAGGPGGGGFANRLRVAPGTLIGKVGDTGAPFVIGENWEGTPGREGKLFLQVAPSPWSNDLSGAYQVKISIK
jgi:hypothetical protein